MTTPRFTRWRVSARTDGASTCVEAATDGVLVAVQNSNLRHPAGPMLTVPVTDWEAFLREVANGRADYGAITSGVVGPFLLERDGHESIAVSDVAVSSTAVRFTRAEWDAFIGGVRDDEEFSVAWLRSSDL